MSYKNKDHTKLFLPEGIKESVLIQYPTGFYDPHWGQGIKQHIFVKANRSKPKRAYKWEKTAAGLLVTRTQ